MANQAGDLTPRRGARGARNGVTGGVKVRGASPPTRRRTAESVARHARLPVDRPRPDALGSHNGAVVPSSAEVADSDGTATGFCDDLGCAPYRLGLCYAEAARPARARGRDFPAASRI